MSSSPVPVRIYRYEVRRLLGQSGNNEIFEAYDPILDRTVKIYRWTPAANALSSSLASLDSCLSGLQGLDVEVFSEGAYICLAAANDGDEGAALESLRKNGLFPGSWPGSRAAGSPGPTARPTPMPPPIPPPLPLPPLVPVPVPPKQEQVESELGAFTAAFGRPSQPPPPELPSEPGAFTSAFNLPADSPPLATSPVGEPGGLTTVFSRVENNPPAPPPPLMGSEPGSFTVAFNAPIDNLPPTIPPRMEQAGGSPPPLPPPNPGGFTTVFSRTGMDTPPLGASGPGDFDPGFNPVPPRAEPGVGSPPPLFPSKPGDFTVAFNRPTDTPITSVPPRLEGVGNPPPLLPPKSGDYTVAFNRPVDASLTQPPPMPSAPPFSPGAVRAESIASVTAPGSEADASVRTKPRSRLARAPKKFGWVWIVTLAGAVIVGMFAAIWLHDNPSLFASRTSSGPVDTKSVKIATPAAEPQDTPSQAAPSQTAPAPQETPQPAPKSEAAVPAAAPPPPAHPSFDCGKAVTADEILICRDAHLAQLDVEMVATYRKAVESLAPGARRGLERAHAKWFTNYSDKCNASPDDTQRSTCIGNSLAEHTRELRKRIRR